MSHPCRAAREPRETTSHLVAIAPAPGKEPVVHGGDETSRYAAAAMRFSCRSCVRRKVKCDRALPECSGCRKGKLECFYQAPAPRKRKRKEGEDVYERLARYERVLQSNGLLQELPASPSPDKQSQKGDAPEEAVSVAPEQEHSSRTGKLVSRDGKSRYFNSILLLPAGQGDLCDLSESEHDQDDGDCETTTTTASTEEQDVSSAGSLSFLTGESVHLAMIGVKQNLTALHPSHEDALKLWDVYLQNVESLCKVLHKPTISKVVEQVSRDPAKASKGDECLLFSLYHFAAFSLSDIECLEIFQRPRRELLATYQRGVLQSLVNASFLKTTSDRVLQAYILFLMAVRSQIDPDTFWSLTGIAVRLAQRMGLHRDGEGQNISPFDVQMRRRLFWQLLPLDSHAGQVSGTGMMISPDSWDTKQPLNINDDQIYPGMKEQPCEQTGPTEMLYCLAKVELSNFYNRTGLKLKGASVSFKDSEDIGRLIDEVESRIESKYLRYCDMMNPLHLLTLGVVRSAANMIRLRNRMALLVDSGINDCDRRDMCALAQKILDTDGVIYSNPSLTKFRWSVRSMFLWDALLCLLFSLSKDGFFSGSETESVWTKVGQVFSNHDEVLERKRALDVVLCDVTLKAWIANPQRGPVSEPRFISAIRNHGHNRRRRQPENASGICSSSDQTPENMPSFDELFGGNDGSDLTFDMNFDANTSDWMFWDQLPRDMTTD